MRRDCEGTVLTLLPESRRTAGQVRLLLLCDAHTSSDDSRCSITGGGGELRRPRETLLTLDPPARAEVEGDETDELEFEA